VAAKAADVTHRSAGLREFGSVIDRSNPVLCRESKKPFAFIANARRKTSPSDLTQLCNVQAARGAKIPTDRIVQALKPTDSQRSALDALNEAAAKAADLLDANCKQDEMLTPPGRVAAMTQRLDAMLEATKIVRPALENFYGLLTDEQKARFNQLTP